MFYSLEQMLSTLVGGWGGFGEYSGPGGPIFRVSGIKSVLLTVEIFNPLAKSLPETCFTPYWVSI